MFLAASVMVDERKRGWRYFLYVVSRYASKERFASLNHVKEDIRLRQRIQSMPHALLRSFSSNVDTLVDICSWTVLIKQSK